MNLPTGHETVLLVEDEPSVLALTARLLRRQGYTVLTATHGDEALYTARQHQQRIHLLLTDLVLPKLSGKIVAERLCAMFPNLKIVFTSGYPDPTMVEDAHPTTSGAFLAKPFSHADLARTVRAILDAQALA
jgi:two-component system, cell cycle sensor histidine kinase and response regulator CckA